MGQLLWIASYPKSGSTWVRAFLHNYIRHPEEPYSINDLMDLSTGESGASLYRGYDSRAPESWTLADVQRMRPLVHRDLTMVHPGLVFVKTHNAALAACGVPLVTPGVTAGAVYLVRDPRDVAVSYSRHLGIGVDATIAFMARAEAMTGGTPHEVIEVLGSWSAHVESWTAGGPHVLRYEDMLERPEGTFGGLVRYLGEEPEAERLARAIRFSRFEELQAQERRGGFIEKPAAAGAFFGGGRAGRWREVLNAAQRRRIERDHAPVMARLGYLF